MMRKALIIGSLTMSGTIKNAGSFVDSLSSNTLRLAVVFIIAGLFFLVLGFTRIDGTKISSSDEYEIRDCY